MLNPIPPNNNRVRYIHDNHGFLDHEHKFNLVLNDKDLPASCKVLHEGGFLSSGYLSNGFITDTAADMKARMSVYAYFDENNNCNSILKPIKCSRLKAH